MKINGYYICGYLCLSHFVLSIFRLFGENSIIKKIFEKHPEAIWKIQKLLDTLPEKINTREQIVLEDINSYLVIRLLWDNKPKRWIMTAYEKR